MPIISKAISTCPETGCISRPQQTFADDYNIESQAMTSNDKIKTMSKHLTFSILLIGITTLIDIWDYPDNNSTLINNHSTMKGYIFLVLTILVLVQGVPVEDEVHLDNPIYTGHRWYSGNPFFI